MTLFGNDDYAAGEAIRLSDFAGDPVVLNFWFPSCPPCVAEMPDFRDGLPEVSRGMEFRFHRGFKLVGLDTVADGQEFVRKMGVNYMLGPDATAVRMGGIVQDYRVTGFSDYGVSLTGMGMSGVGGRGRLAWRSWRRL